MRDKPLHQNPNLKVIICIQRQDRHKKNDIQEEYSPAGRIAVELRCVQLSQDKGHKETNCRKRHEQVPLCNSRKRGTQEHFQITVTIQHELHSEMTGNNTRDAHFRLSLQSGAGASRFRYFVSTCPWCFITLCIALIRCEE